jgi:hypothetical protein
VDATVSHSQEIIIPVLSSYDAPVCLTGSILAQTSETIRTRFFAASDMTAQFGRPQKGRPLPGQQSHPKAGSLDGK